MASLKDGLKWTHLGQSEPGPDYDRFHFASRRSVVWGGEAAGLRRLLFSMLTVYGSSQGNDSEYSAIGQRSGPRGATITPASHGGCMALIHIRLP